MPLPDDFGFSTSIHAADERVPAAAIEFRRERHLQRARALYCLAFR
jgi:hypothetical protein